MDFCLSRRRAGFNSLTDHLYLPDEFGLTIASDTYLHYDIGYYEDIEHVVAYCERCDECVAAFPYSEIEDCTITDLYEEIVEKHRVRTEKLK